MATLQALFRFPGRQTQGLLQSLFALLKIELPVPEHSTLARRRAQLTLRLPLRSLRASRHLAIDSTGFKVYGEGERAPGRGPNGKCANTAPARRRIWRKPHLALDLEGYQLLGL
jgi:hypothetical protein